MWAFLAWCGAGIGLVGCGAGGERGAQVEAPGEVEQTATVRAEPTLAERLERDVRWLVEGFPERSARDREQLNAAGEAIEARLAAMGYEPRREVVPVREGLDGFNVVVEIPGVDRPDEVVVVGAHYDAEVNTPGADDNASGVAAMLELAARFAPGGGREVGRTLRFIAFTNEEASNSRRSLMGSYVSAQTSRQDGETVVAMMSLEMLGYADDTPGSQEYPFPKDAPFVAGMELPDTGDYIAVVGRWGDAELVRRLGSAMEGAGTVRVVAVSLPPVLRDIWRSDHAQYWLAGYQAVMVTDTSFLRNPHYHLPSDTPETLDYGFMAGVVEALDIGILGLLEE
ncbi:MAG: M28 family peptidase [Phycisphaerales bacterium]|nr:M28 family peptidase [Phycisphaerales bacterium]